MVEKQIKETELIIMFLKKEWFQRESNTEITVQDSVKLSKTKVSPPYPLLADKK